MAVKRTPGARALLTLLWMVSAAVPAAAAAPKAIVFVENAGEFEVLYSRARSTATGAAFFGLLGAAVEESARHGNDKELEEKILPSIGDSACPPQLLEALTARLREKGFEARVTEEKPGKSAADSFVIYLDIAACGFKLIDTTSDESAAFVAVEYRVRKPSETRKGKKEQLIITGREKHQWARFEADGDLADRELSAVRQKAGRRLANKLVYMTD